MISIFIFLTLYFWNVCNDVFHPVLSSQDRKVKICCLWLRSVKSFFSWDSKSCFLSPHLLLKESVVNHPGISEVVSCYICSPFYVKIVFISSKWKLGKVKQSSVVWHILWLSVCPLAITDLPHLILEKHILMGFLLTAFYTFEFSWLALCFLPCSLPLWCVSAPGFTIDICSLSQLIPGIFYTV